MSIPELRLDWLDRQESKTVGLHAEPLKFFDELLLLKEELLLLALEAGLLKIYHLACTSDRLTLLNGSGK